MSKEQFRRYQVIQATVDGKTTILEASQALGLSESIPEIRKMLDLHFVI